MSKEKNLKITVNDSIILKDNVKAGAEKRILPPLAKDYRYYKQRGISVIVNIENKQIIEYSISATGQLSKQKILNECIHLVSGRIYSIPVETQMDSDACDTIKVYSDYADKLNVLYVQKGIAYILAIIHGTVLRKGDNLCSLLRYKR